MAINNKKHHLPFGSLWKMKIDHPYSLLVQEGGVAWSCGQCPLDANGQVAHEDDLIAQTHHVVQSIRKILDSSEMRSPMAAKLVVYYVEKFPDLFQEMMFLLKQAFGEKCIIVPVPVPYFYYSGMLIEIDIYAAEAETFSRSAVVEKNGLKIEVMDFDQLVWVKLSAAAGYQRGEDCVRILNEVLEDFDLTTNEFLSDHWFSHQDAPPCLLAAFSTHGFVSDLGAVALTQLPESTAVIGELTFVRRSSAQARSVSTSHRVGNSVLTLRQKGEFFWANVRFEKSGLTLPEQTRKAMIVLNNVLLAHGLSFDQVCKVTTHYVGDSTPSDLHENMTVRNAYFSAPGPASTGLPVDALQGVDSLISIDVFGRIAS
ncbi:hypothetical protein TZ03_06400 [Pseudomonas sp. 10-1B]|uniref:Rid family hydrolase n=1 Tax=Pseudomonas sp. 10-1B TaxID=1546029 RepID=UPI00061FD8B8|nr:Rid family hydrolase [Pseudomonas sp. 10-1B]KIY41733.1 hypothetical protein TZ03_06400 [Pseudomonas sp. 10-1B]